MIKVILSLALCFCASSAFAQFPCCQDSVLQAQPVQSGCDGAIVTTMVDEYGNVYASDGNGCFNQVNNCYPPVIGYNGFIGQRDGCNAITGLHIHPLQRVQQIQIRQRFQQRFRSNGCR